MASTEPYFKWIAIEQTLFVGDTYNIKWAVSNNMYSPYVNIDLSGSNTMVNIASNVNDLSYNLTVPQSFPNGELYIKLSDTTNTDVTINRKINIKTEKNLFNREFEISTNINITEDGNVISTHAGLYGSYGTNKTANNSKKDVSHSKPLLKTLQDGTIIIVLICYLPTTELVLQCRRYDKNFNLLGNFSDTTTFQPIVSLNSEISGQYLALPKSLKISLQCS